MSAYIVTPCEHFTIADIMNGHRCQALCRGPVVTAIPDGPSIVVDRGN